ncbi:MAG: SigE family RNA polymerase sigma factor [Nocardioides sp.]|uniref:SigE family RNA polymerase sigma factor n=1 Tax=Nocardioides sp. TaxID=35761 RepID=UPI003F0C7A3E
MLTADEAGFTAFVSARSGALLRVAYLLNGDHQHAEDLLQTALVQAAKHWERIHTSPEAYVRRTLYTANVSRWRRHRVPEVPLEHDRGAPDVDTPARLALLDALAGLTAKQRTVLVLRYYEDLTEARTAEVLGISVGTVKSTSRQALTRLRERRPDLAELIGSPS